MGDVLFNVSWSVGWEVHWLHRGKLGQRSQRKRRSLIVYLRASVRITSPLWQLSDISRVWPDLRLQRLDLHVAKLTARCHPDHLLAPPLVLGLFFILPIPEFTHSSVLLVDHVSGARHP